MTAGPAIGLGTIAVPAASRANTGYTGVAIALHWLTAVLVLITWPLGLYGASFRNAEGQAVTEIHKPIGIIILTATLVRLVWRARHQPPPLPEATVRLQRIGASASQAALYALLILMPISGWWMTSAFHKHQIDMFGLFKVPYLPVKPGMPSAVAAHGGHQLLGWTVLVLVALHGAAAIKHHLIDKDRVLSRMLGKRN